MRIRSTVLGIAGAIVVTAALGGIARADDQMPENALPQENGVQKAGQGGRGPAQDLERAGNAIGGQKGGGQKSGGQNGGGQNGGGRPGPLGTEAQAGRVDPARLNPTGGTPLSQGD